MLADWKNPPCLAFGAFLYHWGAPEESQWYLSCSFESMAMCLCAQLDSESAFSPGSAYVQTWLSFQSSLHHNNLFYLHNRIKYWSSGLRTKRSESCASSVLCLTGTENCSVRRLFYSCLYLKKIAKFPTFIQCLDQQRWASFVSSSLMRYSMS